MTHFDFFGQVLKEGDNIVISLVGRHSGVFLVRKVLYLTNKMIAIKYRKKIQYYYPRDVIKIEDKLLFIKQMSDE